LTLCPFGAGIIVAVGATPLTCLVVRGALSVEVAVCAQAAVGCVASCRPLAGTAGAAAAVELGLYMPFTAVNTTLYMYMYQRSKCEVKTNNFGRIATRSLPMPPTNLVLILYPLVSEYARAAPVGVREGTAQMVTPHVFIVVAMDRNACTPCKYHSQFALWCSTH
jgi:hypothetical protein